MAFLLDDNQREWQDRCHRFATEVLRPAAARHDRDQEVPWDVLGEARRRGLHGIDAINRMARDPGGLSSAIYAEEMHWGCAGIALAISASWLAATVIAAAGTRAQAGRWLPECFGVGDEVKLAAFAVTEPAVGSDVDSVRTAAKRDGDGWVLNGTKVLISNAGIADVNVIVATVDPALGHRGQATFLVPRDTPGLCFGGNMEKMGIRASHTAEISLEDCRVPDENVLGGVDRLESRIEAARQGRRGGVSEALTTFEITRPLVGAGALGIARAAYEWVLDYLTETPQGTRLLKQQGAQQLLGEVATEIDAARLLVWRASWMGRNGVQPRRGEGSMSKLKAGDVAVWATTALMDLVGPGAGFADNPLEKFFRDAKIFQIFEGTAQIQRLVISRLQLAERLRQRRAQAVETR